VTLFSKEEMMVIRQKRAGTAKKTRSLAEIRASAKEFRKGLEEKPQLRDKYKANPWRELDKGGFTLAELGRLHAACSGKTLTTGCDVFTS
jgi:hypothetical protein